MMASTTHTLTSAHLRRHPKREEDGFLGEQESEHKSVMLREALELLSLKDGEVVFDGTAGAGGHSEAILSAAKVTLIAVDADREAAANVEKRFTHFGKRAVVVVGTFGNIEEILKKEGVVKINKVLFDLGWNRGQLFSGRGFSFMHDEPLLMSYGDTPASGFTARDIVNTWEEKTLADVFFGYGEERYARRIARAIVQRRALEPIETTIELVEIIRDAVPAAYRHGRINPATRSFQALRIAVNDELTQLEKGIAGAWKHLEHGGRIVIITFHSIEDRLVKRAFQQLAKKDGQLLVKKPLVPTDKELSENSSARSAKMRGIEKI